MSCRSRDPDATSLPSGENATVLTENEWPSRVCTVWPVAGSQSRTVLSRDPDAISLPSGEDATALTAGEWSSRVCNVLPVARSRCYQLTVGRECYSIDRE